MVHRRVVIVGSAALAGLAGAAYALLRPRHLHWGASDVETTAEMAGDQIVSKPQLTATRAIDIEAPRDLVWPWLVQMGYGRAGWYSYDQLDNGGRPSAERIISDLQDLAVGDLLPTGPDGGFAVERIEPQRLLVLAIRRPDATTSVAIRLDDRDGDATRLVIRLRLRARTTPAGLGYRLLMETGDFVMMRRMLHGIKRRAETLNADRLSRLELADIPEA